MDVLILGGTHHVGRNAVEVAMDRASHLASTYRRRGRPPRRGDVTAAFAAGLACRPVEETVEATWKWMISEGDPASLASGAIGLHPDKEMVALQIG